MISLRFRMLTFWFIEFPAFQFFIFRWNDLFSGWSAQKSSYSTYCLNLKKMFFSQDFQTTIDFLIWPNFSLEIVQSTTKRDDSNSWWNSSWKKRLFVNDWMFSVRRSHQTVFIAPSSTSDCSQSCQIALKMLIINS